MKNTIFKKIFKTYLITLILSFFLLAISLSQLLNYYFIEQKENLLIQQGEKISTEIAVGFYTGVIDDGKLDSNLNILDEFLDARIWLVGKEGTIYAISTPQDTQYLGQRIETKIMEELNRNKIISEKGTFKGMYKESVLTVGYPIFYRDTVVGAVLIHAPLPEIQKTFRDVYRITILAMMLSILFAYITLYIRTKKILTPLGEISKAAKIISSGEFQKRLEIESEDEIQELAISFNEMADSLEKIEEKRKNFIANLSHDLRSPMTTIRGFVEGILDETIPKEQQQHYLNIVLEESKRLIKMTNDILDLSKMQQGEIKLEKNKFEIHELLRKVLFSFEQRVRKKDLDVEFILCEEYVYVYGDSIYIQRVIFNLLENAIKFTPQREKIILQTSIKESKVYVEIINTGVTMEKEEIKKVWERFYKGDKSRGKDKTGSGLGLSIVKEILRQHEEEIWIESKDERVKFTFTLKKI